MSTQLIQIQSLNQEPAYDCQTCGACCSFFARREAIIDADTEVNEDPSLTYFIEEEVKFRWPDGDEDSVHHEGFVMRTKILKGFPACIALEGEVGKKCSCSVYDIRPTPCRNFQAGSPACLYVRNWAGIYG